MSAARGLFLVLVWSSGFIGAELGARHAPPDTVLTWRCLLTALLLLPWLVRALPGMTARDWVRQGVVALLCQCLYLGGVFWAAAAGVPAGTSALVASLQPALVLLAGVLLAGHRLRRRHVLGLALGTAGVTVTAAADLRTGTSLVALVLPLVAMLALTVGTLLQQRWSAPLPGSGSRPALPLMPTLAVQSVVTAGFFTAVTAAAGHLTPPMTTGFVSTGFAAAVLWATAAGIGSYAAYYLITARDGAARASTLLYLTPATTAVWAAVMLGQPLRGTTVLGLLVCGAAVALLGSAPSGPRAPSVASGSLRVEEPSCVPHNRGPNR